MPTLELLPKVETLTPPILETDSTTLPLELELFRRSLEEQFSIKMHGGRSTKRDNEPTKPVEIITPNNAPKPTEPVPKPKE